MSDRGNGEGPVFVFWQLRRERREVYNVTVTKGRVGL